ncbi:MAG: matrixin, partial [Halobacteriales archaeon]|nr:matrixin [Halobacteriales archaeon]
ETISGDLAGTYYKRVVISLWDIDTDAVGWHIGYWLVYSFERTVTSEDIPPPFVDAQYHERRSDWWR